MIHHRERAQSTVEFALILPVFVMVLFMVVQVGVLARDRVALSHASRAAARTAIVTADLTQIRERAIAASQLSGTRLVVQLEGDSTPGSTRVVTVSYAAPTRVPIIGRFVGDVDFVEQTTVIVE